MATTNANTVYVVARDQAGGWIVSRDGKKTAGTIFSKQKDAIAKARSIAKDSKPGRIAVYNKNGHLVSIELRGLPKIHKSPIKSSLGKSKIDRAAFSIARERLVPA